MSKRFLGSVVFSAAITLLLFAASMALSGGNSLAAAPPNGPEPGVNAPAQPNVGTWTDVAPFPTVTIDFTPAPTSLKLKRAGAAAYPSNGKIYVLGGRAGTDGDDTTLRNIYEYTPGNPGTWTAKSALLDTSAVGNRYTANMAVALLTNTSGVRIYAIGGSSIDSNITATVRIYNPVADSISTLTSADSWPASPVRIPGGYAVANNKLYIFGGFSALGSGAVFTDTWRFDPMAAVGSKWTQLPTANLNLGRGYIAGATLDGMIYAIGGDTWNAGTRTLVPVANVERMDPSQANPTWTNRAVLPTVRGDLGAWAYDTGTGFDISGKIAASGGPYLVPDTKGYLYDPAGNTWGSFPDMTHATRNYAVAQLNGFLYAFGGYDFSGGLPSGANFNQRYDATGLATPTNTRTPTATSTATRTPTRTNTSTITPTATNTPTNVNAYAYFQPAGAITVTLGSKFTLDLMINSGTNNINAAQSYMTFTNSILQNVNATLGGCVLTSTVTADTTTFDAALQNEVCNSSLPCDLIRLIAPPASIAFASGALANPAAQGNFRVAQVAFCANALGDATVHWEFSPPGPKTRDCQIVEETGGVVSNRNLYADYVIHVVSGSSLVGHVTWQGPPAQPNALQQQPITLTLKLGATEVNYPSTTTDSSGFFTVSLGSLPNGTYDWRVKGPKYLANAGTVALSGLQGETDEPSTFNLQPSTSAEMGLMRAGDCDDNNLVNTLDFNILKNTFGKGLGDPGYDARADFTGDNTVNIVDFNLMRGNFGQGGAPPIRPVGR